MVKSSPRSLLVLALLAPLACSKPQEPAGSSSPAAAPTPAAAPSAAALGPIDRQLVAERLGAGATVQPAEGGAVAATLLREGIALSVEGAPVAAELRTELVFRPATAGAVLAGSVELLEDEVSPVIDTLIAHGVRPIGLFSRFLYDSPRVLVLRFEGEGNPALLASGAQSISAVLRDARLRSARPLTALPGDAPERGKLDAKSLGGALGVQATTRGESVLIDVPRPTAAATPSAVPRPLLRASFTGSDVRAAIDGTLVLEQKELLPVLSALRSANLHPVGILPSAGSTTAEQSTLHFRGKGTSVGLVSAVARALAAREPAPPAASAPAPASSSTVGAAGAKH